MRHSKFSEVFAWVNANEPVLLYGEKGTGKTTLVKQIADELELPFYVVSMTRQTTLSYLLGFKNVNGVYGDSMFRKAIEFGGVFLIDEIDAADPNVLLALNTIENGFVSFPDTVVEVHKDFRLVATANPFDEHSRYTGRAALDEATLDRFEKIEIPLDSVLEASMVTAETLAEIHIMREVLEAANVGTRISIRDAKRWDKRKSLGMAEGYIEKVVFKELPGLYEKYLKTAPKVRPKQEDITTVDELWEVISTDGTQFDPSNYEAVWKMTD